MRRASDVYTRSSHPTLFTTFGKLTSLLHIRYAGTIPDVWTPARKRCPTFESGWRIFTKSWEDAYAKQPFRFAGKVPQCEIGDKICTTANSPRACVAQAWQGPCLASPVSRGCLHISMCRACQIRFAKQPAPFLGNPRPECENPPTLVACVCAFDVDASSSLFH